MEVVAQQTDRVYMTVEPGADDCFVVDLGEGSVVHHDHIQVALKWGYWFGVTASESVKAEVLALVADKKHEI